MKKRVFFDVILPPVVGIATLLAGFLVGKSYDLLTLRDVVIGVAVTALLFCGALAVAVLFVSRHHQDEFDAILARLKEIVPPAEYSWLFSDAELAEADKNSGLTHVCSLCPARDLTAQHYGFCLARRSFS